MKNIEKCLNEICALADANKEIDSMYLAAIGRDIVSGKLYKCVDLDCEHCEFGYCTFGEDCRTMFIEWLFNECENSK